MTADNPSEGGDARVPTFGSLLRKHRRDAGLSQEALAERAGLSVDAIAALERGRRRAPRPHTLRLLADALKLDQHPREQLIRSARREGDATAAGAVLRPPPAPTRELIGREDELTASTRLLESGGTRLLTLTGAAGVGKSRLGLATAHALLERFAEGVCWVPLAPIADEAGVAAAMANGLGLRSLDGSDAVDAIAENIGRRRLLLGLDNCAHVHAEVARICSALLERCPRLVLLATTRELLRIPGETVHLVQPLAVPDPTLPADRLDASPAVRLFVDRAAARGFPPPPDALADVARVVRQLEGMPLAIELAAARTNVLTPADLAAELEDSFGILSGGRSESLQAMIELSHNLLTGAERMLFAYASVFRGGWTLDGAIALLAEDLPGADGADGATRRRGEVLDLVARLADKSLIRVGHDGRTARYSMLATIREFAEARLVESGRFDEVSARHAAYFTGLVERAEPNLRGPDQTLWLDRLEAELGNLRGAIRWSVATGAVPEAIRLTGALWSFCYLRGHYTEGRGWLDQALTLPAPAAGDTRYLAKAMLGAGMLAFLQCEYAEAGARLEAARELYTELGDRSGTALVLQRLGGVARERARYEEATRLYSESLAAYTELGDRAGIAWAHNFLGFVAWLSGDLTAAEPLCRQAQEAFRAIGDGEGIAWSLISLGAIAQYSGDLPGAELLLQESLALSQRLGYREGVAWSMNQLGIVERRRGRPEAVARAVHLLDESLAEHRDLGDRWRSASVLEELAAVAMEGGRTEYAAFLLGAADGIREVIEAPVPEIERADLTTTFDAVRARLEPSVFAAAWAAGRAAPLHAVADGYPGRPSRPGHSVTDRLG